MHPKTSFRHSLVISRKSNQLTLVLAHLISRFLSWLSTVEISWRHYFFDGYPAILALAIMNIWDLMVWLRKRLIFWSQSWEIEIPNRSHISWREILHLIVNTVSVFWQFARFWWSAIIWPKQGNIFGRRDVMESFRFHLKLVIFKIM